MRKRTIGVVMSVVLVALACSLARAQQAGPTAAPAADAAPPKPGPQPTVIIDGDHSKIVVREFHLIRDSKAWDELWQRHGASLHHNQVKNPIVVDFASHMVVAIFLGRERQVTGIDFWPVQYPDEPGHAVVGFRPGSYSWGASDLSDAELEARDDASAVTPYAFVIMPRAQRVTVATVEVNGKSPDTQDPRFTSVATLDANTPAVAMLQGKIDLRPAEEPVPAGITGKYRITTGKDKLELVASDRVNDDALAAWRGKRAEILATPRRIRYEVKVPGHVTTFDWWNAYEVMQIKQAQPPQ